MLQNRKDTGKDKNYGACLSHTVGRRCVFIFCVVRVSHEHQVLRPIYLQMLETSGLDQIGGITKKGSAAGLVFMSCSQDTK